MLVVLALVMLVALAVVMSVLVTLRPLAALSFLLVATSVGCIFVSGGACVMLSTLIKTGCP